MLVRRVLPSPSPETTAGLETLLAECGFVEDPAFALTGRDLYFETWDGRLAEAELRLLFREEEGRWRLVEGEHLVAEEPGRPDVPPGGDIRRRLRKHLKGRSVFLQLVVHRRGRVYRTSHPGGADAHSLHWREYVFSDPHVGRRVEGPRVLLVQAGTEGGAVDPTWTFLLDRLHGVTDTEFSPLRDGLRALDLPVPGEPPPGDTNLHPTDGVHTALITHLRAQAHALRQHRRGAILDLDPEYVHQLRVACRRAGAALKVLGRRVDRGRADRLRAEVSRLRATLGPLRDLDVFLAALPADLRRVDAPADAAERILDAFRARRHLALDTVREALTAGAFDTLVHGLEGFPPDETGESPPLSRIAPDLVRKPLRRVTRWGRRDAESLHDDDLHRLRIEFKRLRYVMEILSDLFPRALDRAVRRAVRFQTALGDANDAVVSEGLLRELVALRAAERTPDAEELFLLGQLVRLQQERRETCRTRFLSLWEDFPKAARRLRRALPAREDAAS